MAKIPLLFRLEEDPQQYQVTQNLLRGVWSFSSPQALLDDQSNTLRDSACVSADVIALINHVKPQSQSSINDIRMSFKKNSPGWLLNDSDHVLDKILCLSLRLWLFVNPDLEDETMTLQQSVQKFLSKIRGSSNKWLWLDFCEQTLIKRGKFRIVYTSDIAQHLTFASKSDIRVFSHASVLELYESIAEGAIYPTGLLQELRKTFNLLWPIEDPWVAKRVAYLESKHDVDLETGIGHHEKFDLRTYPMFGERLAKIQDRLEAEELRRSNSRGIKTAIWGIVLTAIFGLMSAITGVMQVWASFQTVSH
ncbi:hypothetical protein MMC10_004034 [Thelotrema lepadinum]|nr:hypothetical protein [Thelotrema lepadinum]